MNFRLAVSAFIVLLFMLGVTATASAADHQPPTQPKNLRVPNVGTNYIALAWDASSDNSGSFSYRVHRVGLSTPVTVPKTQKAYIWRNLEGGQAYSFYVTAVDAAGNVSLPSNTVTASTTVADLIPPTAPTGLTVTDRNSTTVWLSWQPATDNVAVSKYVVYVNNAPYWDVHTTGPTSARAVFLAHSTTYSFYVRAEDTSRNLGPASEPVTATTLASVDTVPPSAPADLVAHDYGCALYELRWTESVDNSDPPNAIRYDVYVNGLLAPQASVMGDFLTEVQVSSGQQTFVVKAVDRSNNTSQPSNAVTVLAPSSCN